MSTLKQETIIINNMLNNLEEDDYKAIISFIEYLSDSRKKKKANDSKDVMSQIQNMFEKDKGWDSEYSMIEDMAAFRKERMNL